VRGSARCDPPVFAAPGGKMSSQVANVPFVYVHHMSRRRKRKERCWWQTERYIKRSGYSGTSLLADMKCQEFRGRYKQLTRMVPADFELLINLVGPKIVKRHTRFRAAIPVQERFLATDDSYTRLQCLFQFCKQTINETALEMCQAVLMH